VQTGLNLYVAERFRFPCRHFHTVFNRTVENFYTRFIFSCSFGAGMVSKMRRPHFPQTILDLTASFLSQKEIFPHHARLCAGCASSRRLAIMFRRLQNVPDPNEIPDSQRR
jgi:hypothetical protein